MEAINSYRQVYGTVSTIVSSRLTDYLALPTRLLLRTAVVVQPLTQEQIDAYLSSGSEQIVSLQQTLSEDAELQALASTPLMLNILKMTYQETSPDKMATTCAFGSKQEQIFATYVRRMLARHSTGVRFTNEQTIHWLTCLLSPCVS